MIELFAKHETRTISVRLPLPDSANSHWLSFSPAGGTRVYTGISPAGKAFRRAVRVAWPEGERPLTGPLRVSVILHGANKSSYDIDNRIKSLLDALKPNPEMDFPGAFLDDSQIDELHVFRGPVRPPAGCCDVLIEAITSKENEKCGSQNVPQNP